MRDKSPGAIVVGAGLAGLSCAYRLQRAGWEVTIHEKSHYPGGRAASLRKDGYLIDTGATGVGDCYTEYMALVDELGLSSEVEYASPVTATLRAGRLYEINADHPYLSGLLSGLFSLPSKLLMLRLFGDLKAMGDKMNFQDVSQGHEYDDESAESYALRRLNRELLDYLVDPLLRALVVARAAAVSRLELMNGMNGLFSTRLLGTRGGMERLPRALADHVGNMCYQSEVTEVRQLHDGVEVQGRKVSSGEPFRQRTDACVLATTLPEAVQIYSPCRSEVAPLADSLRYIPGICVHLGYSVPTRSKAVMVLISTRENADLTLIWLDHNKVSDRAPDGHSLLYLYYDDSVAGQASQKSDAALVNECSEFVETVFPELAGNRDMTHISRWQRAVPLPAPGIYRKMYEVRQNLIDKRSSRVQLAGDYLSCVGQNTAIVYGEEAARNLIETQSDPEKA